MVTESVPTSEKEWKGLIQGKKNKTDLPRLRQSQAEYATKK